MPDTPGEPGGALLTYAGAARVTGKDERTMRRWAKNGRVSVVVTADGPRIPWAELLRLGYSNAAATPAAHPALSDTAPSDTPGAPSAELAALRVEVVQLRERLDEVRADRDAWRQTAQDALRALPAGPGTSDTTLPADAPRRGLWARLRGR